jgi:homoserine kinase
MAIGAPEFRPGVASVRVPATCANLGPGFDALGLALALYDEVEAHTAADGLSVAVHGEGADLPRDETHLVVRAMRATFDKLGGQPPGLSLTCRNRIPHSRGLGSSAAAIVAGVLLARALVVGGEQLLPGEDVLVLAAQLEGHPDNVASCLLGGFTIAWSDPHARAVRLEPHDSVRPVVLIPPFSASTHEARRLLPATVPHTDAAFAAGRAALLVAALTTRPEALFAATEDRLHQGYRAPAMPETAELVQRLRDEGHAAVVSGAGPTVLVLGGPGSAADALAAQAPEGWVVVSPGVDREGAVTASTPSTTRGAGNTPWPPDVAASTSSV